MPFEPQVDGRALERLLGRAPERLELLGGGGNSRVYRVSVPGGDGFALKVYYRDPQDPRDRLGVEFGCLEFLWAHGIRCVPRPLGTDPEAGLGLMAYVPGERMARPGPGDVDASCAFLADLHRLSALPAAAALPSASEACFSLQSVAGNIQARLDRLRALGPGLLDASGLGRFLAEELLPAWEAIRAQAADRARRWGIPLDRDLPAEARTLSPSDFGFHNALKADGKVFFLDFEYFGWDDPAKLLADFLLHPGMALDPGLRERFARGLLDQIPVPGLGERARLAYPLFGIKWCAILLNEFLPGPLHRRRFAAPGPLSPGECQAGQLAKCRAKLRQVVAENDHFILFPAPD